MRLSRSMALALPAACTLRAPRRIACTTRRSTLVVRAQQPDGTPTSPAAAAPPPAAAAAPQQALPVVVTVSSPEQPQHAAFDDEMVAAAESDFTSIGKTAAAEQQAASVRQAVGTPAQPKGFSGLPFGLSLQPPWVRAAAVVGAALAVYLSGTLLLTLFRMGRDPQKKRGKTINKNKMVVDSISKFLPGRREALNPGSFRLLKLQTGFSSVEVFRKYLWFLLRERQYDAEALADLVALKGALGLTDDQVAEALLERAQRVYEKYGAVMVNMEGLSQAGIERKAATRNLFMKLKSLTEAQELLSPQAAAAVDLGKVFGVTQRDILTLSSGYSAEEEGSALQDDSEGEGGVAA